MTERIESNGLILRSIDESDITGLLEFYDRNIEFHKLWVPEYEPGFYTYDYQIRVLEHNLMLREAGSDYRFYIFKKDYPERIIGNISVSNIIRGVLQSAFLGYSVDEKETGKGIATEAIEGIIKFSFCDLLLHRLEANVIPSNAPSIRVLEKLNFVKEGYSKNYLKINGKWQDHIRYALINENYNS